MAGSLGHLALAPRCPDSLGHLLVLAPAVEALGELAVLLVLHGQQQLAGSVRLLVAQVLDVHLDTGHVIYLTIYLLHAASLRPFLSEEAATKLVQGFR